MEKSMKNTGSSFTNAARWSLSFKIGGIFLCSFTVFIAAILPLSVYTVDSTAHTAVHDTVQNSFNHLSIWGRNTFMLYTEI